MNKVWFLIICFIYDGILEIHAQQNFFNVVSSDITEKNKLFFQQQINMTKDELQSNTTMSRGLGIILKSGVEKSIIKDKWYSQSDYISGRQSFGDLIVGTACFISKKQVISGGYQIPNNFSKSQKAVVLEITFLPKEEGKNKKIINLFKQKN